MNWQSQIGQDKWVISTLRKKQGYFVEIGAFDGIRLSNTYALEKTFGWTGLCIEPGAQFANLQKNRSCLKDNSLIHSKTGEKKVFKIDVADEMFSGIAETVGIHAKRNGTLVEKKTTSLIDVFTQHRVPKKIDYLSIDTEGSEYDILASFDFSAYTIDLLTVEHNYEEPKRTRLHTLLRGQGFMRAASVQFDDWYIHRRRVSACARVFSRKLINLGFSLFQ